VFYMLGTSILVFKIVMYLKCLFAKEKVVMLDDYGNLKDNRVNSIQEPKVLPLIYENLSVYVYLAVLLGQKTDGTSRIGQYNYLRLKHSIVYSVHVLK
jgi:hypothetical protein